MNQTLILISSQISRNNKEKIRVIETRLIQENKTNPFFTKVSILLYQELCILCGNLDFAIWINGGEVTIYRIIWLRANGKSGCDQFLPYIPIRLFLWQWNTKHSSLAWKRINIQKRIQHNRASCVLWYKIVSYFRWSNKH